jgi:site-specific DNA-cytosine methylase
MSCGQIALERAGYKVDKYYASEIDKYAIQVTMKNYPDTIQLGDVTKWQDWDLPKIDLLIGGSPCQGFSRSGKGLNFDDPRSKLFFEYVNVLKVVKPKYFLLENVKMKKEWQDIISEYLGVEPIEINSALVSAQNRVRLYWTNIPGIEQPKDKGIYWGDVREHGVNEEKYYYTEKAMQWLGKVSRKKNKVLTVHQDNEKMQMLEASHHKKYSNQRFFGIVDYPSDEQVVAAMRGRYLVNGEQRNGKPATQQYIEFRYDGKTNTLTTVQKDNVVVPFTLPNKVPADEFFFRYITPLECERLQNVSEGYTSSVSNTQRYRMLGNGWTVDVIAHILSFIK